MVLALHLDDLARVALAIVAAFSYAIAAWPLLRIGGRSGAVVGVGVGVAVLFCPLLVGADRVITRALVSVLCAELMFKMIDYARQERRASGHRGTFRDYLRFLVPYPTFGVIYHPGGRRLALRPSPRGEILRALAAAGLVALMLLVVRLVSGIPAVRSCFALDHAVKLVLFVVAIESISGVLYRLDRLAGLETTPLTRNVILARTVGEFWCRYNTRVHDWLDRNVFRPTGGFRAPVRGIVLTFFLSGIFHELMFGIATSRFDGYQFLFFMIQAPAVLASSGFERLSRSWGLAGRIACRGSTIAWFAATSILFFHGVDRVFPFFYASEPCLP